MLLERVFERQMGNRKPGLQIATRILLRGLTTAGVLATGRSNVKL
jgi:hypothetical protein